MDRTETVNALRTVADHVNDVITLLNEAGCSLEAIRRIRTVQVELHQIAIVLLEEHLTSCVTAVVQAGDDHSDALKDINDLFCWANKF